jgi:predicted RNA-binding Zn ribbon-like protein
MAASPGWSSRNAGAGRREPDIGQAPGDLATVQAFVNTLDIELGTDALTSPADLDRWLQQARLTSAADHGAGHQDQPGPRELATAVELREALRGVLRSHAAHSDAGPAAAQVARIAATLRAGIEADQAGRIVVVPAGSGVRAALTRLLLIGAESATAGTWQRLKVCSADDCQWAFYDRSPTRSGCWCSMQICGSRSKSRAYRSRAAKAGA